MRPLGVSPVENEHSDNTVGVQFFFWEGPIFFFEILFLRNLRSILNFQLWLRKLRSRLIYVNNFYNSSIIVLINKIVILDRY